MLYESAELEMAVAFGIATIRFRPGPAWRPVLFALHDALATIDGHPGVDVLVVREFHQLPAHQVVDEAFSRADASALMRLDQDAKRTIAGLPVPTVAYLDGPITEPVLALARACRWRTASARASFAVGQQRWTAGQALRCQLLDFAWPENMAEVHLLTLELEQQQCDRHPRKSTWRSLIERSSGSTGRRAMPLARRQAA